ncbi:unnamed protein product [Nesidiocoris tenuis]|uniref:Uncharacterized protein n=1 Tax=Nesidiocoris tenuis TaxID=355587 RepID=A0A6H5H3H7_9HEMI|nr:unnamed protein product [Nesidiocoris tenuis]
MSLKIFEKQILIDSFYSFFREGGDLERSLERAKAARPGDEDSGISGGGTASGSRAHRPGRDRIQGSLRMRRAKEALSYRMARRRSDRCRLPAVQLRTRKRAVRTQIDVGRLREENGQREIDRRTAGEAVGCTAEEQSRVGQRARIAARGRVEIEKFSSSIAEREYLSQHCQQLLTLVQFCSPDHAEV